MNKFNGIVEGALAIAQETAIKNKNNELSEYHLLWGLISNPSSYSSGTLQKYKKQVKSIIDNLSTIANISVENLRPSSKFSEWITFASSHATQSGKQEICEPDLLRYVHQIFPNLDIFPEEFNDILNTQNEIPDFLINLNELANQGKLDPVIGRNREIRALMEILGRRSKNNPVLVGAAGVGKTAIVEGLAEAITKGKIPEVLEGKTVMSLDMGSLMAGTKFRGEFEQKIQGLIKFIKEKSGEVILFIDEIHQLVGAGRTDGAMDAANLLKPALARGELHCIGATTPNEYQKYILGDSALDRRFRSVVVSEPTKEDSIEILLGIREKHEIHHGIKITDEAIYNAVILSEQYITDKNLPDKAIDLIDEASSALKLSAEAMPAKLVELEGEIRSKKIYAQIEKSKEINKEIELLQTEFNHLKREWDKEVFSMKKIRELKNQLERLKFDFEQAELNQDYEKASKIKYDLIPHIETELGTQQEVSFLKTRDIANIISRQTGIPVEKILMSKQDNILKLENFLNQKVFGQKDALNEIADTLITSHAGLSDNTRPLGSFLLKGPSGVGKTETAKALSKFLFQTEKNLIRLDMSEYSEKHSVAKLIGAPSGYVGYEEGGILTEAVRNKPYAIILFDEIEKAHSDFSDILLQILDDGRLTDNKGRTINFKNCIIFLTSNSKEIEQDFKPEVLGRLDAILEYKQLDNNIMLNLVEKQVMLLNQRLKSKQMEINLDNITLKNLAKKGFDPRYGARPLQSVFNKYIIRPLSKKVLLDKFQSGKYQANWIDKRKNSEVEFNLI